MTLTIDHCVHALGLLFNPYLCTLVPITIITSTQHGLDSSLFICGLTFSLLSWLSHFLTRLNRHYARAAPVCSIRDHRVVLVTGGSSGLGLALTRLLSRSASVINLDIAAPRDPVDGVHTILCDVSDVRAIRRAKEEIVDIFKHIDVVVSNAAIMNPSPILSITDADIDATMNINIRSQFLLAREFVPLMDPGRGHWVTIASSLGYIGVDCLGLYCASKSATISFHETLTAELQRNARDIETTLFVPGQLDTQLFADIDTPNTFLAPVVEAWSLAKLIVEKIDGRVPGVFGEPLYANYLGLMRCLPTGLVRGIRSLAGLDAAAVSLVKRKHNKVSNDDKEELNSAM